MLRGKNKRYTAIFIFFYLPFLPFQTLHTYPLRRECLLLLRFWRRRRASGQLIQGKEKKRAEAGRENFFTASSSYCTCVKVREREKKKKRKSGANPLSSSSSSSSAAAAHLQFPLLSFPYTQREKKEGKPIPIYTWTWKAGEQREQITTKNTFLQTAFNLPQI